MGTFDLNEQQKRIIKAALTLSALVVIVYIVMMLFNGFAHFLSHFSNVLLPLAAAGIIALILRPYYNWILTKVKKPVPAILLVFISVLLPLVGFLFFFGSLLVKQVDELVTVFPTLISQANGLVQKHWPDFSPVVAEHQEELVGALKRVAMGAWSAGMSVYSAITGLFGWFVLPVYLFFFLMAPPFRIDKLDGMLPFLKPETRKDVLFLTDQFIEILVSFFRGQLVIALIQGLLFACGFSLIGLRFGFLLGLMLGLLNIVPYLGNIIGLSICIPLAYFQTDGGASTVLLALVVFGAVQMIEGYFLTPKIMGDRTGLHPLAIMVSIFFWGTALSGISGMLMAVPLSAFLVVFWRLAKEKYIHEWI